MAAPAALLAVKAAAAVATDKRGRTVIASVVAAVLLPFVLVIVMLLSIMDGTSSHNVSAVDLVFREGVISSQVPDEYRKYIVDMRISFTSLEDLIADIDHVEDGELDIERIKSVFMPCILAAHSLPSWHRKSLWTVSWSTEERKDEDGDPYTAAIPITDLGTVYANIRQRLGLGNRGRAGGKCPENLYGGSLWACCSGRNNGWSCYGRRQLPGTAYGGKQVHWLSLPMGRFKSSDVL